MSLTSIHDRRDVRITHMGDVGFASVENGTRYLAATGLYPCVAFSIWHPAEKCAVMAHIVPGTNADIAFDLALGCLLIRTDERDLSQVRAEIFGGRSEAAIDGSTIRQPDAASLELVSSIRQCLTDHGINYSSKRIYARHAQYLMLDLESGALRQYRPDARVAVLPNACFSHIPQPTRPPVHLPLRTAGTGRISGMQLRL